MMILPWWSWQRCFDPRKFSIYLSIYIHVFVVVVVVVAISLVI